MCISCLAIVNELPYKQRKQLTEMWAKMLPRILSGELNGTKMHNASVSWMHNQYMKGAYAGFDGDFNTLVPGSAAYKKLAQIELDSYVFSSIKSNLFLKEADLLKTMFKGQELADNLTALHAKYYHFYSQAEAVHIENVSRTAKQWTEIEEDLERGVFTWLEYHSMQDDRVREEHLALDDTKLLATHPFWRVFMPPNGYNCRCYVTQDFEGPASDGIDVAALQEETKINPMFAKNFGIDAKPFSGKKGHPYFQLDDFEGGKLRDLNLQINKGISTLKGYKPLPDGVEVHASDLTDNARTVKQAQDLVKSGLYKKVRLNPEVNLSQFKNPDTIINGKAIELKAPNGNNLQQYITKRTSEAGAQNAHTVILNIPRLLFNVNDILKALARIDGQKDNYKSVQFIFLQIEDGPVIQISRQDIDFDEITGELKKIEAP